jgi:hypothetical protein
VGSGGSPVLFYQTVSTRCQLQALI